MNARQRRKFVRKIVRELPPGTEVVHLWGTYGGFGKVVEIKTHHHADSFHRCVLVEWSSGAKSWEKPALLLVR